jgi:hypothetical protein
MCQQRCEKLLKCGHNCTSECGQICTEKCMEMIKSNTKAECGHVVELPCYIMTTGRFCHMIKVRIGFYCVRQVVGCEIFISVCYIIFFSNI